MLFICLSHSIFNTVFQEMKALFPGLFCEHGIDAVVELKGQNEWECTSKNNRD